VQDRPGCNLPLVGNNQSFQLPQPRKDLTMSELTLNLIDSQTILCGQIHGSIADSAIAALSAEPETINELEAALARYFKPTDDTSRFLNFRPVSVVNTEPWDAGLVIIDLPSRHRVQHSLSATG
jgi:hypothetical protein